MTRPRLLAISDLHVGQADNRALVERLAPTADGDWLLVAGDVAERLEDVEHVLARLARRFATVVWAPGNHELWTLPRDAEQRRGVARYERLVEICRAYGVVTPEDPYPVWRTDAEELVVVPLFLLYDYSWRPGQLTRDEALARAHDAAVVCTDELLLHPDPFDSRDAWCRARVAATRARLDRLPASSRTVLVSHWPLHPAPTRGLRWPEFALWCGTRLTEDWHLRYRAAAVVHGHLHMPGTRTVDGVPFHEVSVGYPREWQARGIVPAPREIRP